MEPRQYLLLLRRWAWLIILGVVVGVIGGYIFSTLQEPAYRASTKILITQPGDTNAPELLGTSQELAETYAELLLTRPVLDETSERIGDRVSSGQIQVQRIRDAQLVLLSVEDSNPDRAADIANTLVQVFLEQNAQLQQSRYADSEESLQAQIERIDQQINQLETQMSTLSEESFDSQQQAVTAIIANLQNERDQLLQEVNRLQFDYPLVEMRDPNTFRVLQVTATPSLEQRQELAARQARLQELESLMSMYRQIYVNLSVAGDSTQPVSRRTDQIQAALNLYQQIYSNLLNNYENIRMARLSSAPNIIQVEPAVPPPADRPVRPQPLMNMAFGFILGMLLSGGVAVLFETMNNTLRTPEQVTELLQVPVLGYIAEIPDNRKRDNQKTPHVLRHPRSPVTEAFRSLRTNLTFTELDKPLRTLLVSSQGTSEGKTTIAINLAVVIAQTGRRVILVDADLRRPKVHAELGLPNRAGLSNILRERISPQKVFQRYKSDYLQVITSGGLPPNPAEVLSSARMVEVLQELTAQADMVIVDAPPLVFADSIALAANADGVLMVVRPNHTEAESAVAVVEQLDRVGARIVGVVLNWIRSGGTAQYYGNYKTYAQYGVNGSDGGDRISELDDTQPVNVGRK